MTVSASASPSVTLTAPSLTSTFHVPAPSIWNRYELVMPAVLDASTRDSRVSKNSLAVSGMVTPRFQLAAAEPTNGSARTGRRLGGSIRVRTIATIGATAQT